MKAKKLLLVILPIILVVVVAVLCFDNLKSTRPAFLTDTDWNRYSSVHGENVKITFDKGGKFTYTTDSGKPISDFNRYSYNKRFNRIEVSGAGDDFMRIIYRDRHNLCLLADDGVHCFKNQKDPDYVEVIGSANDYIDKDNSVCLTVLEYKKGFLHTAPYNYDSDAKESFKDYFAEIECADNVKFTSVDVRVENGTEKTSVHELSEKDREYIGEYYTGGFLEFDGYGYVKKVIFYGSIVVW